MDRYHALKSFDASYTWAMEDESEGKKQSDSEARTLTFRSPNMFKAESRSSNGFDLTSISDGSKVVEIANKLDQGQSYPSPASIADATSMEMRHPMFNGTLLYKFFGGSQDYDQLVDSRKGSPKLGGEERIGGETARHVTFYATDTYGNTDILIGESSGKVYKITYDDDGLVQQMKAEGTNTVDPSKLKQKTTETYTNIQFDPSVSASLFDTGALAKGKTISDSSAPGEPKPPVAPGSAAPAASFTPLSGGAPVTLNSLKGKPVLIDFWATWCGPCKESLPNTESIYKRYGKDLQVLVVSDEEADTIRGFISKNKYTFPVYRDIGDVSEKTYKVDAIPCTVIIDKDGNLKSYLVGERPESEIASALKSVGVG